ncbi:hypothetical protein CAPTEDRAFT_208891 [Capitella teleta]|uniref:Uncharacterized protein n=1 Tax=Capitella teleta TaxID=283909 RepID=R7UPQ9_CAPTE|nr:hypothetical protein CAPTEDRAFT_208891 [Capitella teleta]|eukprot:ELU08170.1 hypothetical protein CAPTEDRAFT_208891 [Capitella teleta]
MIRDDPSFSITFPRRRRDLETTSREVSFIFLIFGCSICSVAICEAEMSSQDTTPHELALLKSLLRSQSESGTNDENRKENSRVKSGKKSSNARKVSEEQDGDTHKVVLSLSNQRERDQSKEHRKPKRRRQRVQTYIPHIDCDLQAKYNELRLLMSHEYSFQQELAKQRFIHETKRLFADKYGVGNQQHVFLPKAPSPSRRQAAVVGQDGQDITNGDGDEYILIDATQGGNGVTKRVSFKPPSDAPQLSVSVQKPRPVSGYIPRKSRRVSRPQSAPSQRKSTEKKLETAKRKSRRRSPSNSSEYETDSSTESQPGDKSRSRSRDTFDHLLKNTDIPQIQEWLKNKNKLERQQRKEKRKAMREKKKQEAEEIEKKERRLEKSKERVNEWMAQKRKELRLLKRRDRQAKKMCGGGEEEEEEKEDSPAEGNKNNCNCVNIVEGKKTPVVNRPRVQSARASKSPRPQSSRRSEEYRDERRISYEDWVKNKRASDAIKKKEEQERRAKLKGSGDRADEKLISETAHKRIEAMRNLKKKVDTGIEEIDDEANTYPEEKESLGPRYELEGHGGQRPKSAQPKKSKALLQAKRPVSAYNGPQKSRRNFKPSNPASMSYPSSGKKIPSPPKPGIEVTGAYTDVKYQQRSWDGFSEYVWDKLTEEERAEAVDGLNEDEGDGGKKVPRDEEKETELTEENNEDDPEIEKEQIQDENIEEKEKIEAVEQEVEQEVEEEKVREVENEDEETKREIAEESNDDASSEGDEHKKHVHFAPQAVEIHIEEDSEVISENPSPVTEEQETEEELPEKEPKVEEKESED